MLFITHGSFTIGPLLDPEIGRYGERHAQILNLWLLKRTYIVSFLFVYKPLKIHRRKIITLFTQ